MWGARRVTGYTRETADLSRRVTFRRGIEDYAAVNYTFRLLVRTSTTISQVN